jgi:hypothetical protein
MQFQWTKSPTSETLAKLSQTIAKRIARFLDRRWSATGVQRVYATNLARKRP